eukprot:gene8498-5756_t
MDEGDADAPPQPPDIRALGRIAGRVTAAADAAGLGVDIRRMWNMLDALNPGLTHPDADEAAPPTLFGFFSGTAIGSFTAPPRR